jgi:hypothetical protein
VQPRNFDQGNGAMVGQSSKINRPEFLCVERFWTELLRSRGLPTAFRWVFCEDYARMDLGFAFRPRPEAEADRIARFAYRQLDPDNPLVDPSFPLAIVAYAVVDGSVITAFQQDAFMADEDIFREDWNIYFDAKDHLRRQNIVVSDPAAWERLRAEQPFYLSELDYCVSVEKLRTKFGYAG